MDHRNADDDRCLELPDGQFQQLLIELAERLQGELDSLPQQPAESHAGARELSRELAAPAPEQGVPAADLISFLLERCLPVGLNTASPGYFGYIPGGGLPHAALADLISNVFNRFAGIWFASPGQSQIEAAVISWLKTMVGYDASGGGFLTSGGSLANWSAVVTARQHQLGDEFHRGTVYVSDQAHHSVAKAAMLAGIARERCRSIATDADFRIDLKQLRQQIDDDRRHGWSPFLLVANAGTTNTGAIDDLPELAEIAERKQMWLHVDAAYGGFFRLTETGRRLLQGTELADSITLDPHKGLFLPYGTGSLVVRDASHLRQAHQLAADYMPDADPEFSNLSDVSPELSRPCRGLRVWLPVQMHGIGVFRRQLEEKLELARWLAGQLPTLPQLELVSWPQLSIVAFKLRDTGGDLEARNRQNAALLDRINRSGRVFLSSTRLRGELVLRACVLSFRTHREHVEQCWQQIQRAVREG